MHAPYDQPLSSEAPFDLVVFSYALSMFNPGWEEALAAALGDLSPGGALAVVDFHDSPLPAFKRWMGLNHVRPGGVSATRPETTAPRRPVEGLPGLWGALVLLSSLSEQNRHPEPSAVIPRITGQ